LFTRPNQSYEVADTVIHGISRDQASPLFQIAKLLPEGATVLDIGAGSGVLGRVLAHMGNHVTIDGIEPNEFAVELARPFYRSIYAGYAQTYFQAIAAIQYDYVILADVLEHIADPSNFLEELLAHIPSSTKLIISIPNIAFGGVRLALMNGHFDYVDSGLLERPHLRFFTLVSARFFFDALKLYPECILSLNRSFYRVEFPRKQLAASPFTIFSLANDPTARAYQYLFTLTKEPTTTQMLGYVGTSFIRILFDALVAWPVVRRIVQNVRRWRSSKTR
jgi:2-polyprenyl-3-methyl-5-hydroxy-6-metoxy-1,4-benzoquinol methylase